MYSHPISRELEQWWHEHAARPSDPAWQSYLRRFAELLEVKFGELAEEHDNTGHDGQKRFGMSGTGSCTRKAGLKYLGYEGTPFSGSSLVTFQIGHLMECLAVATLESAGYVVGGLQDRVHIDPFMASAWDGVVYLPDYEQMAGDRTILSVKSTGYKHSAQRKGTWIRQGFAALPFDGVYKANPSWWAQAQAEMHGSGIRQALILVVAKDIVKAFERDPYLSEGNGSLTFYAELIQYDPAFGGQIEQEWGEAWRQVQSGTPPRPRVFAPSPGGFVSLPSPADDKNGWGGPNKDATGTFNPCNGCEFLASCKASYAKAWR